MSAGRRGRFARNAALSASVLACLLAVLASCSGSAPEILYPDWRLSALRDPATGDFAEVLRLYVAVRDADGSEDPASITLIQDDAQLSWSLDRETWVELEYGGDTWYGTPDLRMPDGAAFPRGHYRVVVQDASLSEDEADFTIGVEPVGPQSDFPRLVTADDRWSVRYTGEVLFQAYSRSGQLVVSRVVRPGLLSDDVLRQVPREAGVEIFLSTLDDGVRRESGPYPSR